MEKALRLTSRTKTLVIYISNVLASWHAHYMKKERATTLSGSTLAVIVTDNTKDTKRHSRRLATLKTNRSEDKLIESTNNLSSQRFYHGTKVNLKQGDLIEPGFISNYGKRKNASYVYLTATLDAAIWGAELALGEGPGRIYIVEPTGPIEDDPNLTDKKYPGNPTKSYRSRNSIRVSGEVTDWQGHSPEQLKGMREHLERLKQLGIEAIED